jgi:peptidase C39-like protein
VTLLSSFVVALSLAGVADRSALPPPTSLDVPYLSQTEALCGGAALAMVLRYWGDRHADVQQFAPLVDRRAGGIANTTLIEAVEDRGWQTITLAGTLDSLRGQLARNRPVILLIEDRPGRFHYVVAVGGSDAELVFHDPTWGPFRRMAVVDLMRVWQPSRYWALVVLPADGVPRSVAVNPAPTTVNPSATHCDVLLDEAVGEIQRRGLETADEILAGVRAQCPESTRPVSELAGVRFAERRLSEAAVLANQAAQRDAADVYAWDVLGSTRFLQNDLSGALRAWNRIGKPRLDSVQIEGLSRTRYAVVAQTLALTPNAILTADRFRLADRRLQQLPTRASARIGYRLESDGFATADVSIVERPSTPESRLEWVAAGVHSLVDREIAGSTSGGMGQGEKISGSWRLWNQRPRVAISFAAPRIGRLPGVVRVDAFRETESYAATGIVGAIRETRTHGGIALTDWLSPDLRYEIAAGVDVWDHLRRTASAGGVLERRFAADRVAVSVSGQAYVPLSGQAAFQTGGVHAAFRSKRESRGLVQLVSAGLEATTDNAPRALWGGAGDGHARVPLLRAHRLLRDGVIDGDVFGRRLMFASAETQRWFAPVSLARVGVAAFVDAARATRTFGSSAGGALRVDGGAGVRLRLPGREGTLRIDYGRGLRDGQDAVTIGWQLTEPLR